MRTLHRARHVLPVAAPPIADGAVLVRDGRVEAVGPWSDLRDAVGGGVDGAALRDLGDAALLPGLVNAHVHVEWSWLASETTAAPPRGDALNWVRWMIEARARARPADVAQSAREALDAMRMRGTVALGDVANDIAIAPLLAGSGMSGVLFHELIGFRPDDAEALLADAAERLDALEREPAWAAALADGRWRVALAPHAPHTVSGPLLRALGGRAAATGAPLSIHVAETAEEVRFLRRGDGPFADLLRGRGALPDGWAPPGETPVGWLRRLGLTTPRLLAVHCVHLDAADHAALQAGGASVVACPRSNRSLDVGRAPVPALLREGVPVALGTDSLASAPDLDLFGELAALLDDHPGLTPAAALRMATWNGARSLQLEADHGAIAPGRSSRLVVVPLDPPGRDPLEAIAAVPSAVYPLDEAPVA